MSRNNKIPMLKEEVVKSMVSKTNLPYEICKLAYDALVFTIKEGLVEDRIVYVEKLGDFEVREIGSKNTVNPITKKPMVTPTVKTVRFKPSESVKRIVNGKDW